MTIDQETAVKGTKIGCNHQPLTPGPYLPSIHFLRSFPPSCSHSLFLSSVSSEWLSQEMRDTAEER